MNSHRDIDECEISRHEVERFRNCPLALPHILDLDTRHRFNISFNQKAYTLTSRSNVWKNSNTTSERLATANP